MAAILDMPWNGNTFSPPNPLDIATIEGAIVNQLRTQVSAIEIVHYPDRPEAYRMTHRVGAALVSYLGSTYGPLVDTGSIVQDRKLEFEVRLIARDLGWAYGGPADGLNPGAYELLESIRTALTGFIIPGCRKIYPVKERFIGRDPQGGVFIYALTFAVWTVAIEPQSPLTYPSFVSGRALDKSGNTSTAVAASAAFDATDTITLVAGNVANVIVAGSGGELYTAGVDYSIDAVNGVVTRLAGGAIPSGATVELAYNYADTVSATSGTTAPVNTSAS
jgi:hypothetical protein